MTRPFDPARDGLPFRNPRGVLPERGRNAALLDPYDRFVYGDGLCFGMAAYALRRFAAGDNARLAELPLTQDLLDAVRDLHGQQMRPGAVLAVVLGWLRDRGGRPDLVLRRLRLPGESLDPHVLCFGPLGLRPGFLRAMQGAHAVVPCLSVRDRLYVYDPNHPEDRGRYLALRRDGAGRVSGYAYGPFDSGRGWGLALVPISAVDGSRAGRVARGRVEVTLRKVFLRIGARWFAGGR